MPAAAATILALVSDNFLKAARSTLKSRFKSCSDGTFASGDGVSPGNLRAIFSSA
jgi:hypothetical protein